MRIRIWKATANNTSQRVHPSLNLMDVSLDKLSHLSETYPGQTLSIDRKSESSMGEVIAVAFIDKEAMNNHSFEQRRATPLSFQFIGGVTPFGRALAPPGTSHLRKTLKMRYLSLRRAYL